MLCRTQDHLFFHSFGRPLFIHSTTQRTLVSMYCLLTTLLGSYLKEKERVFLALVSNKYFLSFPGFFFLMWRVKRGRELKRREEIESKQRREVEKQ